MAKPEPHWIDDDAECPNCGGEGVTYDCFDGCCEDAEWGCDDCARTCDCQKRQAPAAYPVETHREIDHESRVAITPRVLSD